MNEKSNGRNRRSGREEQSKGGRINEKRREEWERERKTREIFRSGSSTHVPMGWLWNETIKMLKFCWVERRCLRRGRHISWKITATMMRCYIVHFDSAVVIVVGCFQRPCRRRPQRQRAKCTERDTKRQETPRKRKSEAKNEKTAKGRRKKKFKQRKQSLQLTPLVSTTNSVINVDI